MLLLLPDGRCCRHYRRCAAILCWAIARLCPCPCRCCCCVLLLPVLLLPGAHDRNHCGCFQTRATATAAAAAPAAPLCLTSPCCTVIEGGIFIFIRSKCISRFLACEVLSVFPIARDATTWMLLPPSMIFKPKPSPKPMKTLYMHFLFRLFPLDHTLDIENHQPYVTRPPNGRF